METIATNHETRIASLDGWEEIPKDEIQRAISMLEQGGSVSRMIFPSESSGESFKVVFVSEEGREKVELTSTKTLCALGPNNYDTSWWVASLRLRLQSQD